MKVHQRIRTGRRPYRCDEFNNKFSTKSKMKAINLCIMEGVDFGEMSATKYSVSNLS